MTLRLRDLKLVCSKAELATLPKGKLLINTINAFSYNNAHKDTLFAEALLRGDALIPDGISIVKACQWLRTPTTPKERIAGWDLFEFEMQQLSGTHRKVMFLGSNEETLLKIKARLATEQPDVEVITYSPPYKEEFSEEDSKAMIEAINTASPDLLWIGMTAPKQEKWTYSHWDALDINCHCGTVGAVFDFYAGTTNRAPLWFQNHGLEWLYRLYKEPGRMWRRYIIGNAKFLCYTFLERFFLLSLLLTIATLCNAASTITGNVTNEAGEPLPYATVYIEALKQSAICDAYGHYAFPSDLPTGEYLLRASHIGFHTEEQKVRTATGDPTAASGIADFRLKEEAVTLTEYIVLPKGMDICTYVMTQLDKNRKPLKKRITAYSCRNTAHLEKSIDLSDMKRRKTIRFALSLMGWGKNFDTMVKYKDLSVTMAEDIKFHKGKITNSPLKVLAMNPKLTQDELKAFCKKDWYLDDNSYDRFYDEVHKKIKDLKNQKKSKYKIQFCGSYDEGNNTIYIMRYGKTQVEVVSGCWQIRRMRYKSSTRTMTFEFSELSPGVYLPISGHAEYNLDYDGWPHGTVKLSTAYKYYSITK